MDSRLEKALEQRARRSARRVGLIARKSRSGSVLDNLGGFAIVDPETGGLVAGFLYDLTAEDVIERCTAE
jgi:hypothetical protein